MPVEERSPKIQSEYQKELADLKVRKMEFSQMTELKNMPAWTTFKNRQEQVIKNYEIEISNKLALPPDESYPNQVRELHAAKEAIRSVLNCVENPAEIVSKISDRMSWIKEQIERTED